MARATLALAALAVAARAVDEDAWRRIGQTIWDGGDVEVDDVNVIFRRLEQFPEDRGNVATTMSIRLIKLEEQRQENGETLERILLDNLVMGTIHRLDWLLDLAATERAYCETLTEDSMRCSAFREQIANILVTLSNLAKSYPHGMTTQQLAPAAELERVVDERADDIMALVQHAADLAPDDEKIAGAMAHNAGVLRRLLKNVLTPPKTKKQRKKKQRRRDGDGGTL